MTDRPMDTGATEHPDEGLIHAWLDDALSAPEAERLEAHVRSCVECQARVAEARGLIAGASRIVAALDDVPAGTRPGWAQSALAAPGAEPVAAPAATQPPRSAWRWLRVTPGRAAIAATILVALGVTLTHRQVAEESASRVFNPQKADAPATTSVEGSAPMATSPARDALLDSAVARRVAESQGKRTIGAATELAVPSAPAPSPAPQPGADEARERVAAGRAVVRAERETGGAAADRLRVGNATGAAGAANLPTDAAGMAPPAAAPLAQSAAVRADTAVLRKSAEEAGGRSCVRLDSSDPDARWADQSFPLVLAFEPASVGGSRTARVLTATGSPTELRAVWSARGNDSVSISLRRIGYSGSIVLGPESGGRSGYAVSASAPTQLEGVVVRSAETASRARADAAPESRKAAAAPRSAPAPAAPAGPPLRQLRVTARTVSCP